MYITSIGLLIREIISPRRNWTCAPFWWGKYKTKFGKQVWSLEESTFTLLLFVECASRQMWYTPFYINIKIGRLFQIGRFTIIMLEVKKNVGKNKTINSLGKKSVYVVISFNLFRWNYFRQKHILKYQWRKSVFRRNKHFN